MTEIWDRDHVDSLLVESMEDESTEVTVFADKKELTIKLNARGVRQLRLALQRIERNAAQHAE